MERFLELYERYALEGLGVVMILTVILLCVEIHKVNKIRKQMNKIMDKVASYVNAVLQEDEPSSVKKEISEKIISKEIPSKINQEEAQNSLINAVLEEIFP